MQKLVTETSGLFTAKFEAEESDSYTIYHKEGKKVAWLFFDGNFNLCTDGEIELDPDDLITLARFVTDLKVEFFLQYQP